MNHARSKWSIFNLTVWFSAYHVWEWKWKRKKGDIWLVYSVASVMICVKNIWPTQSGLFPSANSISPEACQSWGLCLLLQASGTHFEPPVSDYCNHGMKGEHHRSGTPSTSTWDCFCDIWIHGHSFERRQLTVYICMMWLHQRLHQCKVCLVNRARS